MSGRVTSSFEITGWEEAPYDGPPAGPKLLRALGTKIFHEAKHHGDGRGSLSYKAPLGIQDILVGSDPAQFFVPPYVGHLGWIGARLDVAVDWDEVSDFIHESYRMTAPKCLSAALGG